MGEAMTGYQSKKDMAQDKLDEDDDIQVYKDHGNALLIAYQSGYYDGKKAAQPSQERPWVGLTDDEIEDLFQSAAGADEETHIRFARAIENALRSKNT
jgi:hypothetical protein